MAMDPLTGKVVGYKPFKKRGLNPHKPKPASEKPPAHIVGPLPRMGNKKRAFARAAWLIERHLRGESVDDLSRDLKISKSIVYAQLQMAENHDGIVKKVRENLLATMDKGTDVYRQIFEATPEQLHEFHRGWELKSKAIAALATGLGAFKPESVRETKNTLALVAEEAAAEPPEKAIEGYRVTFEPPPAPPLTLALPESASTVDVKASASERES